MKYTTILLIILIVSFTFVKSKSTDAILERIDILV